MQSVGDPADRLFQARSARGGDGTSEVISFTGGCDGLRLSSYGRRSCKIEATDGYSAGLGNMRAAANVRSVQLALR